MAIANLESLFKANFSVFLDSENII